MLGSSIASFKQSRARQEIAPRIARLLLLASCISATTGGCCSCWGNEPGDAAVDIPACKVPFTWSAAPAKVSSLSEHLAKAPNWMGTSGTNAFFDVRFAGKQTRLPIAYDMDALFDNSGSLIEAKNSATILCRMSGTEKELLTANIGKLEVARVLYHASNVTFALPGVPLDAGTNITFRTETELPGECYQTGVLGFRWTACSSKTVKSPLAAMKSKGTLPVVVSSGKGTFECRGITADSLSKAIAPKFQTVDKAYAELCKSLSVKSGSPSDKLNDELINLAAYTGWADDRVTAAIARRDTLYGAWLTANKPLPVGATPGFPKEIPAMYVSTPLICDAEAKKRYRWVHDETTTPCRFQIVLPKASVPTTIVVSTGQVYQKGEENNWALQFEAMEPDGKELDTIYETELPGGGETADLGASDVVTTWVIGLPSNKPRGPFVLRVQGTYTKKGDIFPTTHYAFMVLPAQ